MTAATTDTQQTWVPYGSTNDCASVGFCSVYCHRWCNVFSLPSPPPIEFDGESSGPNLSPIVIAVIGILVSAFLLFSYYAIISRYYGSFESLRYRLHGPLSENGREFDGGNHGRFRLDQAWQAAPSDGLDESLINKITVYKYMRGNGVVDGTDCPVCLSEFRDDESLRVLPKCSHAFHLRCIDTWLKSHSNCPLCRSNISWPNCTPPPPQLPLPAEAEACEGRRNVDVVVVIEEDLAIGVEEEGHCLLPNSGDVAKDQSKIQRTSRGAEVDNALVDVREDIVEPVRRSFSLDSSVRGGLSMVGVLMRTSAKDELTAAGPSRREQMNENSRSRGLDCVMSSPVALKRSTSTAGRFCLTRNGK